MSDWQPIETAPKADFERILLSSATWPYPAIGYWDSEEHVWADDDGPWAYLNPEDQPTHWMPLPEPPS